MQQYTIAFGLSNVLGEMISASGGTRRRRRLLQGDPDGVAEGWTGMPPFVQEVSMRTVVLPRAWQQQPNSNQQRRWWSWYASSGSNASSSTTLQQQQDMSSYPSKPDGMLSGDSNSSAQERLLRRGIFISATQENLYLVSYQQKSRGMVYGMSMTTTPKAWQLVFDGGPLDAEMKRIVACTSIINMSASIYSQQKGLVACAYADYQNNIRLFGLNIGSGHAFVDLWRPPSAASLVSSLLLDIADLRTELVPVPVDLSGGQLASGFPDLVMGVATGSNRSCIARILLGASVPSFEWLPCQPATMEQPTGMFVSMAFTTSGMDLFAVDEQPSLWRWKRGVVTARFDLQPTVAPYVHPVRSAIWKVMLWSNNRLILATDTSVNLWSQCSPCPAGTVTSNASDAGSIRQRCLCPAGTYNNLVDYRSTCTQCTRASQMCPAGFFRTLKDPVCILKASGQRMLSCMAVEGAGSLYARGTRQSIIITCMLPAMYPVDRGCCPAWQ